MPMQPNLNNLIAALGSSRGAERIVLFGSRARGDNHERSDIDLAVYGLPESKEAAFLDGIDELPTLLKFDVVFISPHTSPALLDEIKRDGVTLYEAQ
ncbi:nucleotidyltransferase family protein [Butyricicoccus faecihominis]|uniref:nucleotidyltransferase family protein n=1 Tax=Butyricicoccus faecihominis TaxID=1712515 RepID=UPI0024794696|nr:nucleotidyltransferase domain-containing protein [Butyricicoccus faecihominis]